MKIISGLSNPNLASRIARELNIELLETKTQFFPDGELRVQVNGAIDQDIIIVQSTNTPVHDHFMELLLLTDTVKRSGAKNVTAIIPYFGYSRQDRCTYKAGPISSNLVIRMLEQSGINHVISVDLHSFRLQKMFNISITNLSTETIFLPILEKNKEDLMMVSPDIGGIIRAKKYCLLLGVGLAVVNKSRDIHNNCLMDTITGNVSGKNCVIVDDIVDGASTLCMATDLLIKYGAKSVEAIITHTVLSHNAKKKIDNSNIKKIYVTDSIFHKTLSNKFMITPIHKLISKIVQRQFI